MKMSRYQRDIFLGDRVDNCFSNQTRTDKRVLNLELALLVIPIFMLVERLKRKVALQLLFPFFHVIGS